jgi:putative intracellular protease/amidase
MAEHKQEFSKPGFCPKDGMELVNKNSLLRVAVLIHQNVEEIDYAGPWEVFGWSGATLFTVAPSLEPISSAFGLKIVPDYDLEHAPEADVLLVPGGGLGIALKDEKLLEWIRQRSQRTRYVMSVCNGAFILAKAGLLDGMSATTTATAIERLASVAPKAHVVRGRRVVDNGKIITTGGLSAGIDGALHIVERQSGRLAAERTARDIEYNWNADANWSRASLADLRMPDVVPRDGSWERLIDTGDKTQWVLKGRLGRETPAMAVLDGMSKKAIDAGWTPRGKSARSREFQTVADGTKWMLSVDLSGDSEPQSLIVTMRIRRATDRTVPRE